MIIPLKWWPWLAAVGVVLSALLYVNHLRRERDLALVRASNAEARADTLKIVYADALTFTAQRLAFTQDTLSIARRKLEHLPAGDTKTVTTLVVVPDMVLVEHRYVDTVPFTEPRTFADSAPGPPATVAATVTFRPPYNVTWLWRVAPTPIPLTVDVGCLGRFRPDVRVIAPAWTQLDSVSTTVAPGVCGSVARRSGGLFPVLTGIAGLLAGLAL